MKTILSVVGLAATLVLAFPLPARGADAASSTPGTAWAWGENTWGQVGDCTTACDVEPVDLSGLGEFVAIDAGWMHTLALRSDGTVWAWGGNRYGQLGDGTAVDSPCPVQVTGLQEVKAIAAGGVFSMALKRDGTVWAWGDNYTRECGICESTQIPVVEPVQIEELSDVIAIDAGVQHGVALKPDGTVWCWGLGLFGILGQGAGDTYRSSCVPLQVVNLTCVTAIAAGADHTLALLSDGTVKGWGQGNCGQLGFGGAFSTSDPATARGMTEVVAIATGSGHSVYLKSDGTVWGAGANDVGQLGVGLPTQNLLPVMIPGFAGATAIGVGRGADRSFVQTEDGGLWLLGKVGICGASTTPVTLMPLPTAQSFTVSTRHMVVLEGTPRLRPPGLSSMWKRTGPYRIEATAYGLQPGFRVFLDEDETPWMHISIVSPTQFVLKGGDKLRARVKKKHPFPFRIVNPDGGQVRVLWEIKKSP
jgi:alpha-tubulin suppressor-like RCC1 family protein